MLGAAIFMRTHGLKKSNFLNPWGAQWDFHPEQSCSPAHLCQKGSWKQFMGRRQMHAQGSLPPFQECVSCMTMARQQCDVSSSGRDWIPNTHPPHNPPGGYVGWSWCRSHTWAQAVCGNTRPISAGKSQHGSGVGQALHAGNMLSSLTDRATGEGVPQRERAKERIQQSIISWFSSCN